MGAQNVAKVFTSWRCLSHRDARLLTFMALISLDSDKPPVYFGGWEGAAEAMGLDATNKRVSAQEVFRKSVASLVKQGALVSSGQARFRVRAEYALTLDPGLTFTPSGTGRGIIWKPVQREASPNKTLPHLPQQNVGAEPNETLGQVPQQNVGTCPNETLPPKRTEEPQGGELEEPHGRISIKSAPSLTSAGEEQKALNENGRSMEDERQRQMRALKQLIEKESAS